MAEPIKWITVNGKHVPIYEEGEGGGKNNPAFDKAVSKLKETYPGVSDVWRIDREGFAVGQMEAGDIFVGHGGMDNTYYKNTPENKQKAEMYWQASTFSREIKRKKGK